MVAKIRKLKRGNWSSTRLREEMSREAREGGKGKKNCYRRWTQISADGEMKPRIFNPELLVADCFGQDVRHVTQMSGDLRHNIALIAI